MKKNFPVILVVACAALFLIGVGQLFKWRFEGGDVYPAYSSLRADPLGTMAFYESLEKVPGMSVYRDHRASNELPEGHATTYLHLAASRFEWEYLPEETFREIEQYLFHGGRLVITLTPEFSDGFRYTPAPEPEEKPKSKSSKKKKAEKKKEEEVKVETILETIALGDRWGLKFALKELPQDTTGVYEPVTVKKQSSLPLPDTLAWHSAVVLTNVPDSWDTVYQRGPNPVVVERRFGSGSVVVATDSYFFSNEAMQKDRHADFLAWMVGSSRIIYFDEAHLGVVETSGVATLARKYRLHWLAAGLIVLALFFIWKNSTSLAPRYVAPSRLDYVEGRESAAGFVNLLRRSISSRDLLAQCFAEWKKSVWATRRYSAARLQQAEATFLALNRRDASERETLHAYQTISKILQPETRSPIVQGQPTTDTQNKHEPRTT